MNKKKKERKCVMEIFTFIKDKKTRQIEITALKMIFKEEDSEFEFKRDVPNVSPFMTYTPRTFLFFLLFHLGLICWSRSPHFNSPYKESFFFFFFQV